MLICDATCINNLYGSDKVGVNPEYKKHNISKLSLICDINQFILLPILCPIKNKFTNYSTLQHESTIIDSHVLDLIHVNTNSK